MTRNELKNKILLMLWKNHKENNEDNKNINSKLLETEPLTFNDIIEELFQQKLIKSKIGTLDIRSGIGAEIVMSFISISDDGIEYLRNIV